MNDPKANPENNHTSNLFVLIEQYQPIDGKHDTILEIAKSSAQVL